MDVLKYIDELDEETKLICLELYDIFTNLPGFESKIRYKIPFFFRQKWLAYINPLKKGGVELCFINGSSIVDPYNLLDNKGRKQVSGVTFMKISDIDPQKLMVLINAAINFEESMKP